MLPFVLPMVTGLLLAAAFPRADQGWLGWVAWIPLIIFTARARNRRMAFAGGWLAGAIEFFILLRWMPEVMGRYGGMPLFLSWAVYLLGIAVVACYTAVACFFVRHLLFRHGERMLLLFPFVWIVIEFLESVSPVEGLPWLLAGYTQTRFPAVLQTADLAGIYGISFLVIVVNTALAWLCLRKGRDFAAWLPAMVAGGFLGVALLYGHIAMQRWEKIDARFHAALLQGNLSVEDARDLLRDKFEQGYVRMADRLATESPDSVDLLVLPESPAPKYFQFDEDYRRTMETLARRYPLGMILSNINIEERADGTEAYLNSAFFLDGDGKLTGIYDKIHLVPFGEYVPYKKLFFFAETVSGEMGGFTAGKDTRVLRLGDHPANAVICFEAVFPDLVRRSVKQGSQVIINLTNDGWYGVSDAPYQHLEIARVRAVENRRYFLRAANSGVSTIIDPIGRMESSTGLMQEAICRGNFAFIEAKTIYTRCGNYLIWLCAIICACGSLVRGRRAGK